MNYYEARQCVLDKKWKYTCMNDGVVWPVGYCRKYKEWTDEEVKTYCVRKEDIELDEKYKDKHHSDGHETQEQAEECYRNYLLDHEVSYNRKSCNSQYKCEICGEWTPLFVMVGKTSLFNLCEKHQNRESVEKLYGRVREIWSS